MRSLGELLRSADGRRFLEERGVSLDPADFVRRLAEPRDERLRDLIGLPPGSLPVYVAHQTHADFRRSVTEKFAAARDLPGDRVVPVLLWLDTDRAGSDKAATTIEWPGAGPDGSVRLVPYRLRNLEARFAPVEAGRLEGVVERLSQWVDGSAGDRAGEARGRVARLAAALEDGGASTLAEANQALAAVVLREHLSFDPPWAFVSTLAARGLLAPTLTDVLNRIDDVVRVFNDAVAELEAAGVDPQVRPLPEDYLPLNRACDSCGSRRRLRRERSGHRHVAVGECSCGWARRFPLGTDELSLDAAADGGRWSVDVTLPLYLDGLVSGVVVGRSSALYGLVLDRVVAEVLGREPVPMLVPAALAAGGSERADANADSDADSLLYDYLVGA